VAFVLLAFGAVAYWRGVRAVRRGGGRWPVRRSVLFAVLGLGSYAVLTFGFPGVYSADVRWVFTARLALLLVVVPTLVMVGRPAELARQALTGVARDRLDSALASRASRVLGNAIVAPLVPFVVFMVLLTPAAGWLRLAIPGQILVTLVVPLLGLLIEVPLLDAGIRRSGYFAIAEFLLAFAELLLDAIPGIVLRISNGLLDHAPALMGAHPAWYPNPLRDQQLAGDLLWFIAEVGDVPAIILLFVRWSRTDRREARDWDDLSDDEIAALTEAHLRRGEE
jgi:putative membrane protein